MRVFLLLFLLFLPCAASLTVKTIQCDDGGTESLFTPRQNNCRKPELRRSAIK